MKQAVLKLLAEADPHLAAAATATPKGRPAIAVVSYAVRDDGKVIVSTHTASHKWRNLESMPEIALTVGWSFDRPHLQVGGDARLLTGDDAKPVAEFFYAEHPEAKAMADAGTGFIEIDPTWARITRFQPDGPPEIEEGVL